MDKTSIEQAKTEINSLNNTTKSKQNAAKEQKKTCEKKKKQCEEKKQEYNSMLKDISKATLNIITMQVLASSIINIGGFIISSIQDIIQTIALFLQQFAIVTNLISIYKQLNQEEQFNYTKLNSLKENIQKMTIRYNQNINFLNELAEKGNGIILDQDIFNTLSGNNDENLILNTDLVKLNDCEE